MYKNAFIAKRFLLKRTASDMVMVIMTQLTCYITIYLRISSQDLENSTERKLVKMTNDLLIASDEVLVLFDLSAAFTTIHHHILLQRPDQSIGIQGIALSWFESYSSDRSQFVCKR